jgi:hypothetical protein
MDLVLLCRRRLVHKSRLFVTKSALIAETAFLRVVILDAVQHQAVVVSSHPKLFVGCRLLRRSPVGSSDEVVDNVGWPITVCRFLQKATFNTGKAVEGSLVAKTTLVAEASPLNGHFSLIAKSAFRSFITESFLDEREPFVSKSSLVTEPAFIAETPLIPEAPFVTKAPLSVGRSFRLQFVLLRCRRPL